MKALILCGGKGTRLMPLTRTTPKQLLPVANKPILFYLLEQIKEADIRDIGIVVCPDTGGRIKEAVGDGSRWSARVSYIEQTKPLGLAHAVKVSQDYIGDDRFLMFLGDNLIDCDVAELVKRFNAGKAEALITLKEMEDPCQFGVAEINDKGEVIGLTEKPKEPKSRLAIAGGYVFTPQIHKAIAETSPSSRGELEITDALQRLLDIGKKVSVYNIEGWWFDIGTREGLLKANSTILDKCLKSDIKGSIDMESKVKGRVSIQQGTRVMDSTIVGPVSIGEGCRIKGSLIGPYVSIGDGAAVEDSAIERSIILQGCRVCKTKLICNSVIGRNTEVITKGETSSEIELFIGDDDRLEL